MFFYLPKYSIIDNGDKMITREEQRKRKKQKKSKFIILLILFTAILLIATFLIIKWMMDNKKVDKITDDIKNNTEVIEVKDDNAENINPPTNEESDYWKYIKMPLIAVDFNNLLEKNSETVGWIKVDIIFQNNSFINVNFITIIIYIRSVMNVYSFNYIINT